MVFEELRSYQVGDDVRQLDWKATRRTRVPVVRVFKEERERPVYVLLDMQQNMFFGSQYRLKVVQAAHLAALLMWQTVSDGDRFGAIVCGQQRQLRFLPHRAENRLLRILQTLVVCNRELKTNEVNDTGLFSRSLGELACLAKHSADIWLISDLEGLSRLPVKILRALVQHNNVTAISMSDPLEKSLPDKGYWSFSNDNQFLQINMGMPGLHNAFSGQYQEKLSELDQELRLLRIPLIQMCAGEPLKHQLIHLARGGK